MKQAKSFEDLMVWQEAHQFVLSIYKQSGKFSNDEKYGITSQIRRASVSIPANIVEGFRRISKKDKLRFYNIAQSSLEECRYYLILIEDLNLLKDNSELLTQLNRVSILLNRYCKGIIYKMQT